MAPIVRNHHLRPGGPRHFGDVRIVNPAAGNRISGRGTQHRHVIGCRQIVNPHPRHHLLLEKRGCVFGLDPVFGGQTRRHRKKFQATMPCCDQALYLLLGDRVEQRLGRRTLRPEIHQSRQQHAGIQKDVHGQRLRSSSISAAMSTRGRLSAADRGPGHKTAAHFDQPWRRRHAFHPETQIVLCDFELRAWRQPCAFAEGRWNHHAACLVNGSSHAINIPSLAPPGDLPSAAALPHDSPAQHFTVFVNDGKRGFMYRTLLRLAAVGTLAVLFVTGVGSARLLAQAGSVASASAKNWIGEWTLTMQGGRGPQERALTIKDAAGKVAATMGGGRGAPIEIADVSMKGTDLVLKFKQQGRGGEVDVVLTLSMQADGTLKVSQVAGANTTEGTGKKKAA